ncbi:hypothetical protein JQN72_03950 [Phycicoccus sp. CSK15P-2]|uniref:hypothetical protein n=1 Tax=Phycicoccus sp. CSK15P-2 TaxID=2807627 RepID=UPI00194E3CE2|nr:hypothetical protein [Phycicoccus sp. CSK15P-2]MBM6403395.1 hypothetical protein [Phycicoccus sp. CSK15P-2]
MATTAPRPVDRDDLDGIASALPEVVREGTEEHPAYSIGGKKFVLWRGPRKDAVDDSTGEPMPDVIAIRTPGEEDKQAILQLGAPWFTTPHFDGYAYVLVRERDLGALDYLELAEIVTDAWATVAPKKLVTRHLG